jgi:enamine deaminase RidA (YjgF/YER057c/UK114 family)
MRIYDKLAELNITLPPVATPAAAYVPFVQTGKLVFMSGHIAKKDGKPWVGQLGKTMQHRRRRRPRPGRLPST